MTAIKTSIDLDDSGYHAAAQRVVADNNKMKASLGGVAETQRQIVPAMTGSSAAFDRLKRSLDPVYDAQKKIEKATRDADAAIRAGRASIEDKAAVLARLSASLQPATGGMRGLGAASEELKGRLAGLGGQAGMLGTALQAVGPAGLAAAAGIGAVVLVLREAIQYSKEISDHFAEIADASERVGTSASRMEALNKVALENAGSVEKVGTALETLQVNAQKAVDGDENLTKAFQRAGVSMQFLREQGGDTAVIFNELSKHGISAADAAELMGKAGKSLIPTLTALHGEMDNLANRGLDPMAKEFDAVSEANTKLSREFKELGAPAALELQKNLLSLRQTLFDLQSWFLKTAEANAEWWDRLFGANIFAVRKTPATGEQPGGAPTDQYTTGGGFGAEPPRKPLRPSGGVAGARAPKGGGGKSEAEKEADKIEELIAKTRQQADAEERLANAAGLSAAALRQAANDNKVAEVAHEHGAAAAARYRVQIERLSTAEQTRQLAGTVLALSQQADAAERLAAVSSQGAEAIHKATIENQAFAEALKYGAQGSREFANAYSRVLEQLQRADEAKAAGATAAGFKSELEKRQDALDVARLELSLMNEGAGKRAEAVTALKEELQLKRSGLGYSQDQIKTLVDLSAAHAKATAEIDEQTQAQKDWNLIARQGIADVVAGLKDVVQGAKTWQEALLGVAQSLGKIAEQQLVEKPMGKMIDKLFSGEETGAGKGGDLGKLGELASGGWSWLQTQFGGGGEFGKSQVTADWTDLKGLKGTAGALNQSAQQLGSAGAAGQLGTAGQALGTMPGIFQSTLGSMVGNMTVNAAVVNINGGAGGGGAGGGGAGGGAGGQAFSWFSSLFGSGTATDTGVSAGAAPSGSMGGYEMSGSSTMMVARGAAFDRGNVIPFARGGIVDRPTLFPMAGGAGLMGERGPEAVLPLRRHPSGRLGVEAPGGKSGGGSGHTVNMPITINGKVDDATIDRFRRTAAQAARDALMAAEEQKRRFG